MTALQRVWGTTSKDSRDWQEREEGMGLPKGVHAMFAFH